MKKFLVLLALAGLFVVACDNEQPTETTGDVNLSVTLNAHSFMAGQTITATITDVSGADVTRGDITLYFYAVDTDAGTYAESMFTSFTETAVLGASEKSVTAEFVFVDEVDQAYNLRLVTAAEACTIDGAHQNIVISNVYAVSLSIPGATDNTVYPGDEFKIQAYSEITPTSDVTISLTYSDGTENHFANLPATIVLEAGKTTGTSDTITATGDGEGLLSFTVSGTTNDDGYEVPDYTFTRGFKLDTDNTFLADETTLYSDPTLTFVSDYLEEQYLANRKDANVKYQLMTRVSKTDASVEPSEHPVASLAAEGWKLINATEFHYGSFTGTQNSYWGTPSTLSDTWGVYSIRVQNGFSTESTAAEQKYSWQSDQNEKYTAIQEDGYVRIWAAYDPSSASADNTGQGTARNIGTDSPKCFTGSVLPSWAVVETGTRIEVRARLGGKRQGFAPILRLRGNASSYDWPLYGEIDFMSNPVYTDDPEESANKVHQAVRWSSSEDNYWISDDYTINADSWNIYWVEFTDASTIKLGINGQTTQTITGSGADWPFCTTFNTSGMYLQISLGVANAVTDHETTDYSYLQSADWADSSFKGISYEESKTSENTPHLDIDWIRVWKNGNNAGTQAGNGGNDGVHFY